MTDRPLFDACALTAMQESMLFSVIADPDSCLYLGQITCDIEGPIDQPRLQDTWNAVVAAHPALRTVFAWEGLDQAVQIVRPSAKITVSHHDWSTLSIPEARIRMARFLEEDLSTPFDLGKAPLMRVALLSLPDSRTKMVWNVHHIVVDGASGQNILEDFVARYNGKPRLPKAPAFRETLEHRNARDCGATDDFWRRYLCNADLSATLNDPQAEGTGDLWVTRTLPSETHAALRAFCHEHKLTPATMLTGAWAIMLSRFGHAHEVVFGLSMSGRTAPLQNLHAAVGPYMNTLPFVVRTDHKDAHVVDFLRTLQTEQIELQTHDHSAQSDIKRAANLPVERPLYETLISINTLESPAAVGHAPDALTLSRVDVQARSNQPMAFLPKVTSNGIDLTLSIDTARFSQDYSETVLTYLEHILRDIAVARSKALKDVAAPQTPPTSFNADLTSPATLHGLIENTASANPDAIAVLSDTDHLSYNVLMTQSRDLAGRLQAAGVKPGARVGLMVERGAELPIGAMGILMAGAAFVPLDPTYPAAHISHVLKDADMTYLVIGTNCQKPATFHGDAISVTGPTAPYEPVETPPDALAYILYTSGSTGTPKGVAVSHQNITASNLARRTTYARKPERFLLLSSFAFDSAFVGLFWPLIEGGTVILPPPGIEKDIDQIAACIKTHRATHTLCIPQLYQLVLTHARSADLTSLTTVIVAGEPCPSSLVDKHFKVLPNAELHNEFGPTEGTIWCTSASLTPDHATRRVPIGNPSPACAVTIRDTGLHPLPDGVVGEICLSGPTVAQGYFSDQDKTRRAFVAQDGDRLYRTGDLGFVGRDTLLYFQGRKDEQLKIRGYRIEPAQIAATLQALPGVQDAAVIAATHADSDISTEDLLTALGQMTPQDATNLIHQVTAHVPDATQGDPS